MFTIIIVELTNTNNKQPYLILYIHHVNTYSQLSNYIIKVYETYDICVVCHIFVGVFCPGYGSQQYS